MTDGTEFETKSTWGKEKILLILILIQNHISLGREDSKDTR